jgi:spectinomycin phosphotransferase
VYTQPTDLDRGQLEAVLERHWGLRAVELEYLPVGFGGHHWLAVDSRETRRFVTADDLDAGFQHGPDTNSAFVALGRAYRTAAVLRDEAKLDFVVAPLPDAEGAVIRRLDDRYAVTVWPFVEGESGSDGSYESANDRRQMGRILGRLHAATDRVPVALPRKDDFAVPSREALAAAIRDLDRPWASGPFAEPARQLLRGSASDVERRFREYDELASQLRGTSESWVITHGEPHSANVIRDVRGGLQLVDWDTTLFAPRERDLRMVLDEDMTGWDEYVGVAGSVSLDRRALRLYATWWDLAEICLFIDVFRRPHQRTEDTEVAWRALTGYLPVRDR